MLSAACISLRVLYHFPTFSFPSKSGGKMLSRLRLSERSLMSPKSSSIDRISSRSLSMAVMNKATVSAISLLEEKVLSMTWLALFYKSSIYKYPMFPLSSLIVIGRSSFILSRAAGQSSLYFLMNDSIVGYSSLWTCLNAALYYQETRH